MKKLSPFVADQLSLFSAETIAAIATLGTAIASIPKTLLTWLSAGLRVPSIDCGTFAPYVPRIVVPSAHEHPFSLNEPTAFAEVSPAVSAGEVDLDVRVVDDGSMSIAQADALARMMEAFAGTLPDGRRAGFLFGDGTGAGKTRPLLAAARAIAKRSEQPVFVFTVKRELIEDFRSEIQAVDGKRTDILDLSRISKHTQIPVKPVIYFGTYATLRTRYEDILRSMPANFRGGIFIDESQNLRRGNDEPLTERGKTARRQKVRRATETGKKLKPFSGQSLQARAFLRLDEAYPDAHVLMVSATAASSIAELRYMSRLGLWGAGTVFPDYPEFVKTIKAAGLSGLELLAQEVAATGRSISRTLSFDGIEYQILRSPLTDDERARYDKYVTFWDGVSAGLEEALVRVNIGQNTAAGKYRSSLTYTRNAFLRMAKMRLRLNALITDAKERLAEGESVVVQVSRTQEAALKAAIKRRPEDVDDNDLDITGSQLVRAYLDECFPTSNYVYDYVKKEMVIEVDPITGAEVQVKAAQGIADDIRRAAEELVIDQSPIDTFIDAMGGAEAVAEYTGRKIRRLSDHNGYRQISKRRASDIRTDLEDFRADNKRVLLFSEAKGGAGINMHADRRWPNSRKRNHYLLELGHRADATIQGMGRTNRTGQESKPRYILVYADVPADLLSTEHFALKMARLGAVTRGDRKGTNVAFFDPDNNLVDETAQHAFKLLIGNLANAQIGSPYIDLARAIAERMFRSPFPSDIDPKKLNLERFLANVDRFPIALQEDFYALFREITEDERETARENGATFGRVDTLAHNGCAILSEHEIRIRNGRPVPNGSPTDPATRLVAIAYLPKPIVVPWSDAYARLTRTTLPDASIAYGQYHDKGAGWFTPAIVCGLWKSHDGNAMVSVLTPYGYHRRHLADLSQLALADVETRWNTLAANLGAPTVQTAWVVETRILALEDVRADPKLIKVQTSDGRRIFGALLSEPATKKMLDAAVGSYEAAVAQMLTRRKAATLTFAQSAQNVDAAETTKATAAA